MNSVSHIGNGKANPKLKDRIAKIEQTLKTCPFCGSDAEIDNTHTAHYWVECMNCGAQVSDPASSRNYHSIRSHQNSIQAAANAWNTRTKL